MKILITPLFTLLFIFTLQAQTKYETEMHKALLEWKNAKTVNDNEKAALHFERIAKVELNNWLPIYYELTIRTLNAFSLDKELALKQIKSIEGKYLILNGLINNDEVLVLKALINTVKVAKDPMTYGQSLSPIIIGDYKKALTINKSNPRAVFFMAQYKMGGAKYWGKDEKEYCPKIEQAIELFNVEKKNNFEPTWGKQTAIRLYNTTCK